jgi:hypothetical protein
MSSSIVARLDLLYVDRDGYRHQARDANTPSALAVNSDAVSENRLSPRSFLLSF